MSMQDVTQLPAEMTLPMLRDALIRATMDGAAFETHVKTLAKTLLIETQQSGCAKTTRVAQAIETIQMLFFLLRSADWPARGNFQLVEGAEYDADWQWMGSYATWRAAIFVLLYPENLLVPNLRTRTTPGFRQLVRQLQGHGRVGQSRRWPARLLMHMKPISAMSARSPVWSVLKLWHRSCQGVVVIEELKVHANWNSCSPSARFLRRAIGRPAQPAQRQMGRTGWGFGTDSECRGRKRICRSGRIFNCGWRSIHPAICKDP